MYIVKNRGIKITISIKLGVPAFGEYNVFVHNVAQYVKPGKNLNLSYYLK